MLTDKPLVDKNYLLQKFSGKGGWTYAAIPEVPKNPHTPFGWVRVRGSIDGFRLEKCKLQPMGNGQLFLPVNATIRKKIGKEAGDTVHIILFEEEISEQIRLELRLCLENEPEEIRDTFYHLSDFLQDNYLGWLQDAKTEEEKANRILKLIEELATY
ncbi:MAG: YdeI/OmpD-associated family protein [Flavobacteriales bacterium]|nr:YdeI/OmpD-associated family protein [Flavobacteriales bacterium]